MGKNKVLITSEGCDPCDDLKKELRERGINLKEVEVNWGGENDPIKFVPTLIDGDNMIEGKERIVEEVE